MIHDTGSLQCNDANDDGREHHCHALEITKNLIFFSKNRKF